MYNQRTGEHYAANTGYNHPEYGNCSILFSGF
jgi:hypothetical protein